MAHVRRGIWRLGSRMGLDTIVADSYTPSSQEAPQVNLPHVDTQLNMHQYNGFFEDGSTPADGLRDSHGSPTSKPSASPDAPNNENATTEWSAVGHAATGKSGRVIHNLQEEIARLTRECSLYRSRAEETQRSNETLKSQMQNMSDRLRNLEQVNETNLNSIARKDRKLDELRTELQTERAKRQEAEREASKTNQMMRDEQEIHNREQAHSQEVVKYHEAQYEVLVGTTKREKADFSRRIKAIWNEVHSIAEAQKTKDVCSERLDVIADQKNREIEVLKEAHEKLLASHASYKNTKDNELRGTIERAHANNAMIDATIESIRETQAQMRWALQVNNITPPKRPGDQGQSSPSDPSI